MYKVLVSALHRVGLFSDIFSILENNNCKVIKSPYKHPVKKNDLLKIIGDIDAIIVGADEMSEEVIKAAKKLKIIAKYGVGIDNIDIETATQNRIVVTFVPNQSAVADLTIGLMFCLARRICEANISVKEGKWESFFGLEIFRKTLGIIGGGRIGQTVIKRMKNFEMNILVYDIQKNIKLAEKYDFTYTSLENLLKEADFVTVHVPYNNNTKGLLGYNEIKLMKPSAYLINTARGGIVNEDALLEALKEKRIAGAALDVHTKEPISSSPFFKYDNVIMTPHMGSSSKDTLKNMDLITAENILKVLRGENPLYSLN